MIPTLAFGITPPDPRDQRGIHEVKVFGSL
jgi:hypothetical protein